MVHSVERRPQQVCRSSASASLWMSRGTARPWTVTASSSPGRWVTLTCGRLLMWQNHTSAHHTPSGPAAPSRPIFTTTAITCRSEGVNLVSVEQRHATRANAQRARQVRQTNELASDFPRFVTLSKRTLMPLTVRRWPLPSCKPIVLSWTARWWVCGLSVATGC